MKVAHIGPPIGRGGGPSGYTFELRKAAKDDPNVIFPPLAEAPPPPKAPSVSAKLRAKAGEIKRTILGEPKFFRHAEEDLRRAGGPLHEMMADLERRMVEDSSASLTAAERAEADVLFVHDPLVAGELLRTRRLRKKVWLFVHAPMPLALYHAWCFGVPEKSWEEVVAYPDVRDWIQRELMVWRSVDCLIFPSVEAAKGFAIFGKDFKGIGNGARFLLTGAAAPKTGNASRDELRRQWGFEPEKRIGLFIGTAQPYRGLDLLLEALEDLRLSTGALAVAGPPKDSLPKNPHLIPLGRVSAVGDLLHAVDFVVNANRFSLFDLSLIEACQAGKPLLLSEIGGNKTFERLGAGCRFFSGMENGSIVAGLNEMFACPDQELVKMGEGSAACYNAELTLEKLWSRHKQLYREMEGR